MNRDETIQPTLHRDLPDYVRAAKAREETARREDAMYVYGVMTGMQ